MSIREGARCVYRGFRLEKAYKMHVRRDMVRGMAVYDKDQEKSQGEVKERKFTDDLKDEDDGTRGLKGYDGLSTLDRFQSLRKRTGVQTVRAYKPKPNAEQIMKKIVMDNCNPQKDWMSVPLDNRKIKFKLLTKFMKELDHTMHSNELNNMKAVADAVTYFTTEVKDTTVIDDMSRLDLPKNLNINTEYIRWYPDPETDQFKGRSPFPRIRTKSFSEKFKRKYPPPPVDEFEQ